MWIEVASSWINAVKYTAREKALEISLHNGKTYVYFDVEQAVYNQLLTAASKGRFYNDHIKNLYNSLRLDAQDDD